MEKTLNPQLASRYEQWSEDHVRGAVRELARAAAYSERSREHTDAPIGAEHNLWFLVRTIAAEYGFSPTYAIESARRYAQENS